MKIFERCIAIGLSLGLSLVLASGCNSLIGAGAPNLVDGFGGADAGAACLLNSQCPDAQICVFRECSKQCAEDKDCLLGRCLPTAAGNACVIPASATCSGDADCPAGSQCLGKACRAACSDSSGCLADQTCIAGACIGNDSTHDPVMSSGGAGGTGGTGGEAGASPTEGGTGGRAGSGGVSGSSAGGASGSGGANGGAGGMAPECAPGYVACDNLTPLSCQDGKILPSGPNCPYACANGACTGECTVGKTGCTGQIFESCGTDNKWTTTSCGSVCDATQGCIGSCVLNSLQCSGTTELDICTAGSYVKQQTCAVNGECAKVNGVAKCAACGDSDKLCPPNCTSATDVDCPKEPGEACTATTTCRIGTCGAEGVCCDTTCGDSCHSCRIPGKGGTCTAIDYSKSSDTSNCGACGTVCSNNHGTPACTAGTCVDSCSTGYASCNAASVNDGCETSTTSDPANCSACGSACKYGECANSGCPFTKVGPGPDVDSAPFGAKGGPVLFAMPLGTVSAGKVAALGLYAVVGGGQASVSAYLALYSSSGVSPGSLLAETNLLTTIDGATGATEGLINPPVAIATGSYWIVLEASDQIDLHTAVQTSTTNWFYNSMPFTFAKLTTNLLPGSVTSVTLPRAIMYAITTP